MINPHIRKADTGCNERERFGISQSVDSCLYFPMSGCKSGRKRHPNSTRLPHCHGVLALANLEMQPGSEENIPGYSGNGRSCKKTWPEYSPVRLPETSGKYGSPRNSQLRNLNGKRYVATAETPAIGENLGS